MQVIVINKHMGVQFEEDDTVRRYASEKTPKLAGWLIQKGLARDIAGANKLQIIVSVIFFVLAVYFAF